MSQRTQLPPKSGLDWSERSLTGSAPIGKNHALVFSCTGEEPGLADPLYLRRRSRTDAPPRCPGKVNKPLLFLLLAGGTVGAGAADSDLFALCRSDATTPALPSPPPSGATLLSADRAVSDGDGTITLTGSVEALRAGQFLQANAGRYRPGAGIVDASGNVSYLREDMRIEGESGEFGLGTETGLVIGSRFELFERHARGEAATARMLDRDVTVLDEAWYTTCDPGREDWLLRAARVRLDRESGVGVAHHARLSFMRVPLLYTPWISFPIDDRRRSGFLYPDIRDSSRSGLELSLPYYLNLAPNRDATITPRHLKKRGSMIESEIRYLGRNHHGQLDIGWLPNDRQTGRDRSLFSYRHQTLPGTGPSVDVDYNHVSDADYLRDFGNDLGIVSLTHLEKRATLGYQARHWLATAGLQRYQTVDDDIRPAARPYRLEPVLSFGTQLPEHNFRPGLKLAATHVNFRHAIRVEGQRYEIRPALSYPMYGLAGFIEPSVSLRHTGYRLDNAAPGDSQLTRTLPIITVDSGIFLERRLDLRGRTLIQTLEPRAFFLHVPYREQDHLPQFDTGTPDFNFSQLFRDNRFNGADRVGDAHHVALALVTRLIDATNGRERLTAGIGQIHHFRDRRVQLGGRPPETASRSDLVGEATGQAGNVTLRLDARRSEHNGHLDRAGLDMAYRPGPRRLLGIGYRYREKVVEQADLTVLWPLGARWHVLARHSHSLHDRRTLETITGLEYRSCCWRLRLVSRRYLDGVAEGRDAEYNRSIYAQLEFIGLASLGDDLEDLLERGILRQ